MADGDHSSSPLRSLAVSRLRKRRDFRVHLCVYLAVNALLVIVWAFNGGPFWPIFPILGWGIGIGFNAWDVYWRRPIGEDEVAREVERLGG